MVQENLFPEIDSAKEIKARTKAEIERIEQKEMEERKEKEEKIRREKITRAQEEGGVHFDVFYLKTDYSIPLHVEERQLLVDAFAPQEIKEAMYVNAKWHWLQHQNFEVFLRLLKEEDNI